MVNRSSCESTNSRRLAKEWQAATADAPSYEGQFGPEVRAIGEEGHARFTHDAESCQALAAYLAEKAEAFEAADLQTQEGMARIHAVLLDWLQQTKHLLPLRLLSLFPTDEIARLMDLAGLEKSGDGGHDGPWWLPQPISAEEFGLNANSLMRLLVMLGILPPPPGQPTPTRAQTPPATSSAPIMTSTPHPSQPTSSTATGSNSQGQGPTPSAVPTPTPWRTPSAEEMQRQREELERALERRRQELEHEAFLADPAGTVLKLSFKNTEKAHRVPNKMNQVVVASRKTAMLWKSGRSSTWRSHSLMTSCGRSSNHSYRRRGCADFAILGVSRLIIGRR